MSKIFNRIGGITPRRSVFNLSYEKKFDADMGQLIPVGVDEVVPGDVFVLGNNILARMNPMVAPIMHEVNIYVHSFFVPNRILDEHWEEFITGGVDGQSQVQLPLWKPTNNQQYSLWDYMGFPIGVDPDGAYPIDYPRRAYNMIYNEYYRDQNLIQEVPLDNESILHRSWEKDYFTSALPWQQRGIAPALPINISGIVNAVWDDNVVPSLTLNRTTDGSGTLLASAGENNTSPLMLKLDNAKKLGITGSIGNLKNALNNNTIDGSKFNATTFDVSDLRLAFQVQRWMERNARAGVRYTEFLRAHYGVAPRDERLDRPEYIGGTKTPLVVSEVLQTSATDSQPTPQGNLAGHGISFDGSRIGSYRVKEFGWIISIMSIMPRTQYQQGINRQFLRRSRFDFMSPEFVNLSEQPIYTAEIYATNSKEDNEDVFGFQGRYNEMRYKENQTAGALRNTLNFWHLGRVFDNKPELNASFINCIPRKDYLAVPTEKAMIIQYANLIKAFRPIPYMSEPGLIDHN
jgi:hypothetical protein